MDYVIEQFVTIEQVNSVFSKAIPELERMEASFWRGVLSSFMGDSNLSKDVSSYYDAKTITPRVVADALNHSTSRSELELWINALECWLERWDQLLNKVREDSDHLYPILVICKESGDPDFRIEELRDDEGNIIIGDDYRHHSPEDAFTYFSMDCDLNRHVAVFLLAYAKHEARQSTPESESCPVIFPRDFNGFINKGLLKPEKLEKEWFLMAQDGRTARGLIFEMVDLNIGLPKTKDIVAHVRVKRNGKPEALNEGSIKRYRSDALNRISDNPSKK